MEVDWRDREQRCTAVSVSQRNAKISMSTHGGPHHGPHHNGADQKSVPYWKRAHRSWIFYVGIVLMLTAIMAYVMSFDLAWRPRVGTAQPTPADAVGK